MEGVDMGNRETTATFIGGGDMGNTGAHCYIHGRGGYGEYRSLLLHPWKGWICGIQELTATSMEGVDRGNIGAHCKIHKRGG